VEYKVFEDEYVVDNEDRIVAVEVGNEDHYFAQDIVEDGKPDHV
jgi:hypothetical protein